MDRGRLQELLGRFGEAKVLVVGDFFLDRYLIIDAELSEVSIETGLAAYQVVRKRLSPGAAGTVTNNLRALGVGSVRALSVIGSDGEGFELKRALEATGVDTSAVIESPVRFTPTYTKPMLLTDRVEREMERQDIKNRSPLPPELEDEVMRKLREMVSEADGVVIADQVQERDCGVITGRVRDELAALARDSPGVWFLADSRMRIGEFRGVCVKPNKYEIARASDPAYAGEPTVRQAEESARAMAQRNGLPVFATVEAEGIVVADGSGSGRVPAVPVSGETDPVGAGDSCTAGIMSALCAGASLEEAAAMGNLAASVTVGKVGTTGTASPEEILQAFEAWPGRV